MKARYKYKSFSKIIHQKSITMKFYEINYKKYCRMRHEK